MQAYYFPAAVVVISLVAVFFSYIRHDDPQKKTPLITLPQFHGKVLRVLDGDTIDVRDGAGVVHRVRICGMDAPETGQPGGVEAAAALNTVISGKTVQVESVEIDAYKRIIAYVTMDGQSVGLSMVKAGLAWADRYGKLNREYIMAEHAASGAKKGIWAPAAPSPRYPAEFRREGR